MAVHIFSANALERMGNVEGEHWFKYQLDPRPEDFTSFQAFKKAWSKLSEESKNSSAQPHVLVTSWYKHYSETAIYGDHGYSRYVVRHSGEILYLEAMKPTRAHAERARAEGFRFL
jgi:hypothetical protein